MKDKPMMLGDAEPGSTGWFWAAAATIIATLATVVAALYKAQIAMKDAEIKSGGERETMLRKEIQEGEKRYDDAIAKLNDEIDECRKDREELRVQMARFETRLGMLEQHDRISSDIASRITKRLDNLEQNS